MVNKKPDIKPDIKPVSDRGESIALMEPLLIGESSKHRGALNDLALELAQKSAGFRRSLPDSLLTSLDDLVRAMNCYYSNLIEGHDTHPIEIERALKGDYSKDAKKRDLQLEAKAHIDVQRWIDSGSLKGRSVSADSITDIHRRFCEALPDDLLWVEALPRFLKRFEEVYGKLGKTDTIVATAAAHHRLLWIHPFLDGNGRVARLMSHATLLDALHTGGVWSIARGLARNVESYKSHLTACDLTRRNDLDGRGHLSEENLAAFTSFFLTTCIDQVTFMEGLMQPDRLRARILLWAEEEIRLNKLPPKSGAVLEALLYRGELPRGDAAAILSTGERQARRVVSALTEHGVLASESTRAPLHLAFPATLASRWMPGLFPERTA
jgi:Fic family protein